MLDRTVVDSITLSASRNFPLLYLLRYYYISIIFVRDLFTVAFLWSKIGLIRVKLRVRKKVENTNCTKALKICKINLNDASFIRLDALHNSSHTYDTRWSAVVIYADIGSRRNWSSCFQTRWVTRYHAVQVATHPVYFYPITHLWWVFDLMASGPCVRKLFASGSVNRRVVSARLSLLGATMYELPYRFAPFWSQTNPSTTSHTVSWLSHI